MDIKNKNEECICGLNLWIEIVAKNGYSTGKFRCKKCGYKTKRKYIYEEVKKES